MRTNSTLIRRTKLTTVLLLAAIALAGCTRSILGATQSFSLLAGKKIVASVPIMPAGNVGAPEGVTNIPNNSTPDLISTALGALQTTQGRLQTLPVREVTAAELLGAPVAPGFYHVSGSLTVPAGQSLTLAGDGVYVFNTDGALVLGDGSAISLGTEVQAANVFWNTRTSASLGVNAQFSGILIAEGDITVGANAVAGGKLLSRTGSILVGTPQFSDPTTSGPLEPALHVPANTYQVKPGQTVSFTVGADFLGGSGQMGLFVKGLPAGATQVPNVGGKDAVGPNGSDLLALGPVTGPFQSTFTWVPQVTGTYRITYFARGAAPATVVSADGTGLNSAIDFCTVTIVVAKSTSTPGGVAGTGSFGSGATSGTFSLSVGSRGTGAGVAPSGLLRITNNDPRLSLQSDRIESVEVADLGGGRRIATVTGTMLVPNFGRVPFSATAVDGGTSASPDEFQLTVMADLRHNGSPVTVFGGVLNRRGGEIVIR